MRTIKVFLILSLLISMMSCIERTRPSSSEMDAATIQSMQSPRIIRDTIIQIVLLDTVDKKQEVAVVEQPKKVVRPTTTRTEAADPYDPNNSGFFDTYRANYKGDPNEGKETIVRTVTVTDNADQKKEAIERSLDMLEKQNEKEQTRYEQLEKERQIINQKAIEDAKAKQKQQQQQQQRPAQGRTLNTDVLINN